MSNLIMGYWDCQYCGTKGNRGDTRACPSCGHPRDESVKFYMKDTTHVSDAEASKVSKNPDWYCSFCNTLNSDNDVVCKSCGASKAESEADYFDLRKKEQEKAGDYVAKRNAERDRAQAERQEALRKERMASQKRKRSIGLGVLGVALLGLVLLLMPKKQEATVTEVSWNRTISIEQYANVDESDWSLPAGANLHETREEIHHYDQVLDHYETVEVQKSEQVLDGYDTTTNYVDLGNGYFEEQTVQTPRYTTRYYTETEQRPVYRDEPVYHTKYYYDIWKWIPSRKVESGAADHEPFWGEPNMTESERESGRNETYKIKVSAKKEKIYDYTVDKDVWDTLNVNDSIIIKVHPAGDDELLDKDGNVIAILHD